MTRPMSYENGLWLGPWVAEDPSSRSNLAETVLSQAGGKRYRLGTLEVNRGCQDLLARYGSRSISRSPGVLRPAHETGDPSGIYAEAGHRKRA